MASKPKTDEEIGKEAAARASEAIVKLAKSVGLTAKKTLQRINEGLDAVETKPSYDKDRGRWAYSKDMIDWAARAKSIDQAITVLDLKPADKVEHSGKLTLEDIVAGVIDGKS